MGGVGGLFGQGKLLRSLGNQLFKVEAMHIELIFGPIAFADVHVGSNQSQRSPRGVTRHHLAAMENLDPVAVLVAHAVRGY